MSKRVIHCVLTEGVDVPIKELTPHELETLKTAYTYPNPAYLAAAQHSPWGPPKTIPQTFQLFDDYKPGVITLPRGTGAATLKATVGEVALSFTDRRSTAPTTYPDGLPEGFSWTPDQVRVLDSVTAAMAKSQASCGTYLFLASTSVGKTFLLLDLARRTGQAALIITPTQQIFLAWQEAIEKLFGLPPSKVGLIRGPKMKLLHPVTLAFPMTLRNRDQHWNEINSKFGCLILDEGQNVAAASLHEFVRQSTAAYRLSATATDTRRDVEVPQLEAHFGKPLVNVKAYGNTKTVMKLAQVRVIHTMYTFPFVYGALSWDKMLTHMAADYARINLICDWVCRDYEGGRVILVTARTRDLIMCYYDELHVVRGIPDVNLITGDTNGSIARSRLLLRAVNGGYARVVLATDAAIKEGANIPRLDSMHVTTPFASRDGLRQLFGRIRRRHRLKPAPIITIYRDSQNRYLEGVYNEYTLPVIQEHTEDGAHSNETEATKNQERARQWLESLQVRS